MPPKRKSKDKILQMQLTGRMQPKPTPEQAAINMKLIEATKPGGGVSRLQNRIRMLEHEISSGVASQVPSIRRHFRKIISEDRAQIKAIEQAASVPFWDDEFQWKKSWQPRFPPPPPPPGVV